MLWSRISAFFFNRMNRTNIGSSVLCARVPGLAPQITKALFSRIRKRTAKNKKSTRRIRAPHSFATQLSLDGGKIGHATATAIATQAEIKSVMLFAAIETQQQPRHSGNNRSASRDCDPLQSRDCDPLHAIHGHNKTSVSARHR